MPRRPSYQQQVFLASLHYDASPNDVMALARRLALSPVSCHIPLDANGRARGIAFLEMPTAAEAADAIAVLSGAVLMGREIVAEPVRQKDARPPRERRDVVASGRAGYRGLGQE